MNFQYKYIIIGLGNPGQRYENNRHNIGFHVIDQLVNQLSIDWSSFWFDKFDSDIGAYEDRLYVKPQMFMNESGVIFQIKDYYGININNIIVIHDELDFNLGRIAIKLGGGHGGHNGLKNIIDCCESKDFIRIRMGIGKPEDKNIIEWVLSDFNENEKDIVNNMIIKASEAVNDILEQNIDFAMKKYNCLKE